MSKEQLLNREILVEEFLLLFEHRDYEDQLIAALYRDIWRKREDQAMMVKKKELMRQIAIRSASRGTQSKKEEASKASAQTIRTADMFNNTQYTINSTANEKGNVGGEYYLTNDDI